MARECFQDQEVANELNQHFICIKVDKEERPDIDSVYMSEDMRIYFLCICIVDIFSPCCFTIPVRDLWKRFC